MSEDRRLELLKAVFRAHDPAGLLKMGAPADEYDSYAGKLDETLDLFHDCELPGRVKYAVFVVLNWMFRAMGIGHTITLERLDAMAHEVGKDVADIVERTR